MKTSTLCDLEVINYDSSGRHTHDATSHNHTKTNGHQKADGGHQHHTDEDEPCCNDIYAQFEQALFLKLLKRKVFHAKYVLLYIFKYISFNLTRYQSIHNVYHEYDNPPPLSGFAIRVYIQSFLN